MKNSTSALVAVAVVFATLPAFAQAPEGGGTRYAVVPFAALSGEVPPRAGQKAAGMLGGELKNTEGVQLVELKRTSTPGADPHADGLAKARAWVEEARAARAARKFRVAEEKLAGALTAFRTHAAGLTDPSELQDATTLLAAVQYLTGRDEEGQKTLQAAVALSPKRELPLTQSSRLFAQVVADTQKGLTQGPKGTLAFESQPQGAHVSVDGVLLGRTPLEVRDVPPGPHLWRVTLPTGGQVGGVVDVQAGKTAKVMGKSEGTDAEARLLTALGQNQLDTTALSAARELAQQTGADVLLFGALSLQGKGLSLEPFTLHTATGEVRRLPQRSFDTELLNASLELYNLVGELSKSSPVGELVRVPASVLRTGALASARTSEARYGVALRGDTEAPAAEVEEAAGTSEGPRAPLAPAKRTPLKRR